MSLTPPLGSHRSAVDESRWCLKINIQEKSKSGRERDGWEKVFSSTQFIDVNLLPSEFSMKSAGDSASSSHYSSTPPSSHTGQTHASSLSLRPGRNKHAPSQPGAVRRGSKPFCSIKAASTENVFSFPLDYNQNKDKGYPFTNIHL